MSFNTQFPVGEESYTVYGHSGSLCFIIHAYCSIWTALLEEDSVNQLIDALVDVQSEALTNFRYIERQKLFEVPRCCSPYHRGIEKLVVRNLIFYIWNSDEFKEEHAKASMQFDMYRSVQLSHASQQVQSWSETKVKNIVQNHTT